MKQLSVYKTLLSQAEAWSKWTKENSTPDLKERTDTLVRRALSIPVVWC